MTTRLDAILASRRARVEECSGEAAAVRRRAEARRGTVGRLAHSLRGDELRLIAEIKRRSPSAGAIAPIGFDPVAQALRYERAGAAAISIVVERDHFDGDPEWVPRVAAAVSLPILWKDFVVDEHVLHEAAAAGASAVLLIVAALDDRALGGLVRRATELGLDVLVEVHDESEAERALSAGARIVGVNSRDLRTFTVDFETPRRVARVLPRDVVRVAESGIGCRDDVIALGVAGFDAILVGETLMRAVDPEARIRELMGDRRAPGP